LNSGNGKALMIGRRLGRRKSGVKATTAKVVAQSPKPAIALLAGTPISLRLG
jgi:hypothetical protein